MKKECVCIEMKIRQSQNIMAKIQVSNRDGCDTESW